MKEELKRLRLVATSRGSVDAEEAADFGASREDFPKPPKRPKARQWEAASRL